MELNELQRNLRSNVVEHLQTLASAEAQLKFQRDVPFVNVTVELVCMWFDDNYLPTNQAFVTAFSEQELQAMADFTEIFEEIFQSSLSGEEMPQIEAFIHTSEWERLSHAAATALTVFDLSAHA